jgi:nitric oxide reductase subunit B
MEVGSIWGHGAYVAPDWTADWLHRELVAVLDGWARAEHGVAYEQLAAGDAAALRDRLTKEYRVNTYDARTGTIAVSNDRARAIESTIAYYTRLFADGRDAYALPKGTVDDPKRARELATYFFWSAWAASTERPGDSITYTSNWPHEPLIGNRPTPDAVVWTGVSIIVLLGGIAALGFWFAARRKEDGPPEVPATDPMEGITPTPSQRATVKYFWVVAGLFVLQLVVGVLTAHYGVEGSKFFGIPLAKILPYSVTRTWHLQLGIFWIATAWVAAGLALAPAIGKEPRGQKLLVNVLFLALVVVVLGSMAGELAAAHGMVGADNTAR